MLACITFTGELQLHPATQAARETVCAIFVDRSSFEVAFIALDGVCPASTLAMEDKDPAHTGNHGHLGLRGLLVAKRRS